MEVTSVFHKGCKVGMGSSVLKNERTRLWTRNVNNGSVLSATGRVRERERKKRVTGRVDELKG